MNTFQYRYRLRTPVLMYHKVGYIGGNSKDNFLNVSASDFRHQMTALSCLGYRVLPFGDIADALQRQISLPPRTCAITFDDGYACVGEIAAPILASFQFPATVFMPTAGIGQTNAWDAGTRNPVSRLLNWRELTRLQAQGWEIGGHTHAHPHLDRLDDADALRDIVEGKNILEDYFGQRLRTFCYPYGVFNARTPALVAQAGFVGACTTRSGLIRAHTPRMQLPRVKIASHDGVNGMLYRLLLRPYLPTLRVWRESQRTPITALADVAPEAASRKTA